MMKVQKITAVLKGTVIFLLATCALMVAACGQNDSPADGTSATDITVDGTTTAAGDTGTEGDDTGVVIPPVKVNENLLYNGIELPESWPPKNVSQMFNETIEIPYLSEISEGGTHPDTVNINVGRQLFVDDFLIDSTNLTSNAHTATPYEGNPVFTTQYATGTHIKHGGLYYNSEKKLYELWYTAQTSVWYTTSTDGINWSESQMVFRVGYGAYATVVKNEATADPMQKYVMLIRWSNGIYRTLDGYDSTASDFPYIIYTSSNGKNWRIAANGGNTGDATSIFFNPFRNKWVVSMRKSSVLLGRYRDYFETDDIVADAKKSDEESVFWLRADSNDIRDPVIGDQPEIYSFSSVAYESVMLGATQLFLGPGNTQIEATGIPKVTNIHLSFSRDGFYYYRPTRVATISCSQVKDTWNRGYLHQVNTICVIKGDELWFYYSGYAGDESKGGSGVSNGGSLDNCSFGISVMRRDGFVSLDGTGTVTTRKLTFTEGQKYLFINAKADTLKAEICDADGKVIEGFSAAECVAFSGDSTCTQLKWNSGKDLSSLEGSEFTVKFTVEKGEFYSFWVSATQDGNSNGYYAGGLAE